MSEKTIVRKGSCHCGAVEFEAQLPEVLTGSRCNCSICARKGILMIYAPLEAVRITRGEDDLTCYRFNTMVARHYFCSHCGIHTFHQTRSDPDKYAINAETLEGVRSYEDFEDVPVYDGVHHSKDNAGVRRKAGTLKFVASPDGNWNEDHG